MPTRLYLTPADHGRALSWEEFASADAEEGYRYEMIQGRVFVSPVPGLPHDDIVDWLKSLFLAYSQLHPELIRRSRGLPECSFPSD